MSIGEIATCLRHHLHLMIVKDNQKDYSLHNNRFYDNIRYVQHSTILPTDIGKFNRIYLETKLICRMYFNIYICHCYKNIQYTVFAYV